MRNSMLLKWANNNNNKQQSAKSGSRNWIHAPDALQRGHIAYLVKYLGNTEVDQPKGIEVVKEGIRKLQFSQQIRKAEGNKPPKVELTISVDGVAIQEPRTKRILHQFPLHRISYCADDKGEKRFFSFIAKQPDADAHVCFVFVSDKLAEEITVTIGQAFDLAYRRFLETSGRDLDAHRRILVWQQRVRVLEHEGQILRQRLNDIAALLPQGDLESYLSRQGLTDLLSIPPPPTQPASTSSENNSNGDNISATSTNTENSAPLINVSSTSNGTSESSTSLNSTAHQPPPVPPRAFQSAFGLINETPTVGTKLEGLLLEELEDDFNPRAFENATNGHHTTDNGLLNNNNGDHSLLNGTSSPPPLLAPPPPKAPRDPARVRAAAAAVAANTSPFGAEDLFGSTPFNPIGNNLNNGTPVSLPPPQIPPRAHVNNNSTSNNSSTVDPFGMGDFASGTENELESALGFLDKRILEMKDGFSRGLSIGNDDFSLESLDPLRN